MRTILQSINDELLIDLSFIRDKFFLSEDDNYIKKILIMAIEEIELQRGLSLRKKTWKIIHNNCYFNLNFGPVNKIISIKDSFDKDLKPLHISRSHDNIMLKFDKDLGFICVEYESGYSKDNLPFCLQNTILEKFWELYSEDALNNEQDSDCDFHNISVKKTFDWKNL